MKEEGRVLIVCVDRDNDISLKSKLKTPIVGRDDVQRAATKLILADPEESDANAMFEAIRVYNRLSPDMSCEVATIAGHERGGIRADAKLAKELDAVLERFPADKAIVITDGFADEFVLPIIQSRLPIMSVRRVVVKHSESLEEFGAILTRYARRIVEDPRYSRFVLGIPGLLVMALAILWFFQLLRYASLVLLVMIGLTLFVKGFKIDERLESTWLSFKESFAKPHQQVRVYTAAVGTIAIGIGLYRALVHLSATYQGIEMEMLAPSIPRLVAEFIAYSIDMIVAGTCIILVGGAIYYWFAHSAKFRHRVIGVVVTLAIYPVAMEMSYILIDPTRPLHLLIYWIAAGVIAILLTTVIALRLRHHARRK